LDGLQLTVINFFNNLVCYCLDYLSW